MIDTQTIKLLKALAYYRDLPDYGSYLPFDQADITPITPEEFYKWCNGSRQCRLCDILYGANYRRAKTLGDDS